MASVQTADIQCGDSDNGTESESPGSTAPDGGLGVKYTDTESGFRGLVSVSEHRPPPDMNLPA